MRKRGPRREGGFSVFRESENKAAACLSEERLKKVTRLALIRIILGNNSYIVKENLWFLRIF